MGDGLSAVGLQSNFPNFPNFGVLGCRLPDFRPTTQQKHEPGLKGRARAGRGRGFSEGGGIGDPGSLSASIYVAGRTADS
jgi:hypothetical protein